MMDARGMLLECLCLRFLLDLAEAPILRVLFMTAADIVAALACRDVPRRYSYTSR